MAQANEAAAALLSEYAELLQMTGGDMFRVRVYEKAARAVAGHAADITGLGPAQLQKIPGVGKSIAEKVTEIGATGTFAALEDLRGRIPAGVLALTRIPALGPKRALALHEELGVSSPAELKGAIAAGQLAGLRGFGARSEEKLLRGIELLESSGGRVLLDVAAQTAARVVAAVSAAPGCLRCEYAGSLRRWRETIGDVDVLAAAADSAPLMAALTGLPEAVEVIGSGPTKTSIRTGAGLQVDLRVIPLDAWGAALQYFTGSQAHNVRVREIAVRRKLKLSEYGLFDAGTGELIVSQTEQEVYQRLGMAWIPPAMREDTGEVQAAQRGELPALVTESDLRGDLHTHTSLTDGVATLEEMVAAARARGYAYYAVTDHAPNLWMQRMTDEKMLAQREQLRKLAGRLAGDEGAGPPMVLLHGAELNIAPDGSVDWDEDFLAGFDVCVASVHSNFDLPRAEMTRRLITACENPRVNIIGHPLARKAGRRPAIDVDLPELFRACARTGTALEINAHPARLDLPSAHIRTARDAGVRFAIDSDAHSVGHLANMIYGAGTAQRGWLTPGDVINTWPLDRLTAFLAKPGS
ncbi:MAG TPA: DNA polymerase/3'-5' exonuclease PolX [Streptosporangiaceae bacterium]|nr:DNA polymerase/3'-5' exonuclease PolX [Streptosporangiaceae bacterium]